MIPSGNVAVITASFNHAQYLLACLDSLIQQTWGDWVCFIMDDGSTDDTERIAARYTSQDTRIHYARQTNQGPSAARNHAIQMCDSEFILPLDADDRIAPTCLEKTVRAANEHSKARIIYTNARYFGTRNEPMDLKPYRYGEILKGNIIPVTALYRRADYLTTSGYDEAMRAGWEDWDFWLSMLSPEDEVFKIEEELFFYRRQDSTRNSMISTETAYQLRKYIYQKHFAVYRQYFEDPLNLAYRIKQQEQVIRDLEKKDLVGRLQRKARRMINRLVVRRD